MFDDEPKTADAAIHIRAAALLALVEFDTDDALVSGVAIDILRAVAQRLDGDAAAKVTAWADYLDALDIGTWGPGTNAGHGHVWERPDGTRVPCGGPGWCGECKRDKVRLSGRSGER